MSQYTRVALKEKTVIQLTKAKQKILELEPNNSNPSNDKVILRALEEYNKP